MSGKTGIWSVVNRKWFKKKKKKASDVPRRIKKSEFYDDSRGEKEVQNIQMIVKSRGNTKFNTKV